MKCEHAYWLVYTDELQRRRQKRLKKKRDEKRRERKNEAQSPQTSKVLLFEQLSLFNSLFLNL